MEKIQLQTYYRINTDEFTPYLDLDHELRIGNSSGPMSCIVSQRSVGEEMYEEILWITTVRIDAPNFVVDYLDGERPFEIPELIGAVDRSSPIADYPQNVKDFVEAAQRNLDASTNKLIGALIWRAGLLGGPVGVKGNIGRLRWARATEEAGDYGFLKRGIPTGVQTISLPDTQTIEREFKFPDSIPNSTTAIPPLSHELFREAWRNVEPHPRSALVMGVAAVETGIKSLLVDLAPQTGWLVLNLPSPPLHKIVREFIPTLPTRCNFSGKTLRPPTNVHKDLVQAIELRNQLVHGRGTDVSEETAKSLLLSLRDLLYLFDYYAGHEWAIDRVRKQTVSAMQNQLI